MGRGPQAPPPAAVLLKVRLPSLGLWAVIVAAATALLLQGTDASPAVLIKMQYTPPASSRRDSRSQCRQEDTWLPVCVFQDYSKLKAAATDEVYCLEQHDLKADPLSTRIDLSVLTIGVSIHGTKLPVQDPPVRVAAGDVVLVELKDPKAKNRALRVTVNDKQMAYLSNKRSIPVVHHAPGVALDVIIFVGGHKALRRKLPEARKGSAWAFEPSQQLQIAMVAPDVKEGDALSEGVANSATTCDFKKGNMAELHIAARGARRWNQPNCKAVSASSQADPTPSRSASAYGRPGEPATKPQGSDEVVIWLRIGVRFAVQLPKGQTPDADKQYKALIAVATSINTFMAKKGFKRPAMVEDPEPPASTWNNNGNLDKGSKVDKNVLNNNGNLDKGSKSDKNVFNNNGAKSDTSKAGTKTTTNNNSNNNHNKAARVELPGPLPEKAQSYDLWVIKKGWVKDGLVAELSRLKLPSPCVVSFLVTAYQGATLVGASMSNNTFGVP